MAFIKTIIVICDGKSDFGSVECNSWVQKLNLNTFEVKALLIKKGWTYQQGKMYCPKCSKRKRKE